MRVATGILGFCLAMAALTAAAKVMALIAISLALLRPIETLKLIAGLLAVGLVARHPVVAMTCAGVTIAAGVVRRK